MKKGLKLALIFFTCLLLPTVSCRENRPENFCEPLPPWVRIYFTPQNHVPERLVSLIENAQNRIWAAFYSLTILEIADALLDARERGVDVRVVMDDVSTRPNYSQAFILWEGGVLKTDHSPSDLMHNKFVLIDGFITWTGSYNPSHTGTYRDDNNVIVISSVALTAEYEREFLEMWQGLFGKDSPEGNQPTPIALPGATVEVYFSPEDDCAGRLIELIRGAEESVHFATFCFTLEAVAVALVEKHYAGVEVKGVMERGQNSPWTCFRLFEDCGMDVCWDRNLCYLHHKFFVIDGETVITGSFNPTRHAREANDENLLIVHNQAVAERYLAEFQKLRERKWE